MERPALLGDKTFLSVGAVFLALTLVGGGAWWLSAMYSSLATLTIRQGETTLKLEKIEEAIRDTSANAVSSHDFRVWVMSLKAQNSTINVPEWLGK